MFQSSYHSDFGPLCPDACGALPPPPVLCRAVVLPASLLYALHPPSLCFYIYIYTTIAILFRTPSLSHHVTTTSNLAMHALLHPVISSRYPLFYYISLSLSLSLEKPLFNNPGSYLLRTRRNTAIHAHIQHTTGANRFSLSHLPQGVLVLQASCFEHFLLQLPQSSPRFRDATTPVAGTGERRIPSSPLFLLYLFASSSSSSFFVFFILPNPFCTLSERALLSSSSNTSLAAHHHYTSLRCALQILIPCLIFQHVQESQLHTHTHKHAPPNDLRECESSE